MLFLPCSSRMRLRAALLGVAFTLSLCLAACVSVSTPCQQQISDCLKRCEASGAPTGPAPTSLPPQNTLSYCEQHCSCKKGSPPAPQSAGKPTPTGTVP